MYGSAAGCVFMKLTFLLPGNSYSGGVRVTMQMANRLLERGHDVRIAYRTHPLFSWESFISFARTLKFRCCAIRETQWLSCFKGEKERFVKLESLNFNEGEIVVATGEHTIEELERLERKVIKVRYCHGFLGQSAEQRNLAWGGRMDTIAVSPALVPSLQRHCEGRILGIVPNGICLNEYFVEDRFRDGIGLVFSQTPIKGPEVAVSLVRAFRDVCPSNPCYVFGADPRPKSLAPCDYKRYPSVAKAREIYNRCIVWFVTSRDEGFSLPTLEAMACGCAVVSSRHTNAGELIQDGVNGLTVPYGDIAAYMQAARFLLENESLRSNIVREGFKTVRKFTWDNAADRMEEALAKLNGLHPTHVLDSPRDQYHQAVD